MTDYLLDTNILILQLRNRQTVRAFLAPLLQFGAVYISTVTRTEIIAGMHPHEEVMTMTLLDFIEARPIDRAVADLAGKLIYRYARQGVQLSLPDAQIAATALLDDLTLVTTNSKHFPMPELKIKTP